MSLFSLETFFSFRLIESQGRVERAESKCLRIKQGLFTLTSTNSKLKNRALFNRYSWELDLRIDKNGGADVTFE